MSDSVQAVTSSCGLLAAIRTPACALAVWPEAIDLPELAPGWSRRMHAWRGPLQPELADPDAICAAVDAEPSAALTAALRQFIDVAASIHGARPFELRIDVISSTMCRWFHADQVALRLLLTLAGAGTECLPVPTAIRAGLSSGLQAAPAGWTPLTCECGVPQLP